jgi:hypothetical protein
LLEIIGAMRLFVCIVLVFAVTAVGVYSAEEQQQQQCSIDSGAVFGPKVHFPDDGNHNDNVREVLMAMGFSLTDNAAGTQQCCCVQAGGRCHLYGTCCDGSPVTP